MGRATLQTRSHQVSLTAVAETGRGANELDRACPCPTPRISALCLNCPLLHESVFLDSSCMSC